jgi:riboflavin biosynthesis pyrimidine reductase
MERDGMIWSGVLMSNSRPKVISHNIASANGRVGPLLIPDPWWFAPGSEALAPEQTHQVELAGADTMWPFEAVDRPAASADPPTGLGNEPFATDTLSSSDGPIRAIIDSRGRLPAEAFDAHRQLHADNRLLVLVAAETPANYRAFLRERQVPHVALGEDRVDLGAALRWFGDKLDAKVVLSNSGGRLNGALLSAGLLDELWIELLPAIIPYTGCATLFDGPPITAGYQRVDLELVEAITSATGRVALRYRPRVD